MDVEDPQVDGAEGEEGDFGDMGDAGDEEKFGMDGMEEGDQEGMEWGGEDQDQQ